MKTHFLAGIALLTMLSCTDKAIDADYNPQLPAITQTGANTFGCKINGVIMIPQNEKTQGTPGGGLNKGLKYWVYGNEARCIEATDSQYNRGGVYIKIPNIITDLGEFNIEYIDAGFAPTYPNVLYLQVFKSGKFYGSIENTGKINITRNDGNVFSGTFYCKVKNRDDDKDIIEVTEGRFDFKVN